MVSQQGLSAGRNRAVRSFDARALATYPDYRAAVIETPNGPYFIKLTGPAKTIAAHDKVFEQFLSSVKYQP